MLGADKEGWFGEHATKDVMEVANKPLQTNYKFEDMFKCDPKAKYYGYKSWDGKTLFSSVDKHWSGFRNNTNNRQISSPVSCKRMPVRLPHPKTTV